MSDIILMLFNGTEIMFNPNKEYIKRKKTLVAKRELRIAKARMKHTIIERSTNRIRHIATEALDG